MHQLLQSVRAVRYVRALRLSMGYCASKDAQQNQCWESQRFEYTPLMTTP
jgi:hypothetical protein